DLSRPLPSSGGTAPFTNTIDQGVLPHGTSVAPGELRLVGSADSPGSYPFQMTATDLAGSASTLPTTGVVCVPFGTTPLALGSAACGYWFDAVQGSTASFSINTEAKQPKRSLRVVVLDTDGTTVLPVNVRLAKGKASISGFTAPSTGRFYVIVASDTG